MIELLVVLIIILTVTALLLPAINSVRSHAKATLCGSNIGKLLYSMLAYESLNDSLPYSFHMRIDAPPNGYPGGTYDRLGWWWFNYIDVYSGNAPGKPNLLKCPAKYLTQRSYNLNILWGNYGVNTSICRKPTGTKQAETEFLGKSFRRDNISNPGETVLIVDSGYAVINWQKVKSPPDTGTPKKAEDAAYIPGLSVNNQRKLWPGAGQELDAINGRHFGKTINAGFVDGHVSLIKAEELLTDSKGNPKGDSGIKWKAK